MKTSTMLNPAVNESSVTSAKADVMSIWRKWGWQPPSEYRNFAQACRPAITAGMQKLALARSLHTVSDWD